MTRSPMFDLRASAARLRLRGIDPGPAPAEPSPLDPHRRAILDGLALRIARRAVDGGRPEHTVPLPDGRVLPAREALEALAPDDDLTWPGDLRNVPGGY